MSPHTVMHLPPGATVWIELDRFDGDDSAHDASREAREQSERMPGPVEVWREGPHGPSHVATYLHGERQ